jgi:1-acyl-sn-glycerol-3-phosphate acyltransferase
VDFLVLLIALDGESPWTRDEISTARNLGALVVPIVIDGATFAPGLFGDLEYITVAPGHVGDAFIPLLEALTYIRRRRP